MATTTSERATTERSRFRDCRRRLPVGRAAIWVGFVGHIVPASPAVFEFHDD
jgi:hypothetical protein